MRNWLLLPLFAIALGTPRLSHADTLTIREDDGNTATIDARWIGDRIGLVALERADGRIELVPQQQILSRQVNEDPEPITHEEMAKRLTKEFGEKTFRYHIDKPFVVGLVLSDELPKNADARAMSCLKQGAAFMRKVDKDFSDFVNELKIESEKPRYPLVVLIFETDDDFMQFNIKDTGGRGLAAGNVLGYYSGVTNRLVIRMSECHTFSTPLHEAIHQQAFNRGLTKRMAPIPLWFAEGIATGFEGNGDRISGGPMRVNKYHARVAMKSKNVNWDDVVADDLAFRGDVLAGEAYAHAWSIHWFLITKYRKQYVEFLRIISQKSPLEIDDAGTRVQDFESVFGKTVGKLQSEFPGWLDQSVKKQRVSLNNTQPAGYVAKQSNLGGVEVTIIKNVNSSLVEIEGQMRNLSHIRAMSFHITLESNAGTYAEWYLPKVEPLKISALPKRNPFLKMKGAPDHGDEYTFELKVKSAVPDSEMGQAWKRGELPVPVFSDR